MAVSKPDDWAETDGYGYSPSCYDPDEYNTECLECGSKLMKAGDRAGAIAKCPMHGMVFSL